MKKLAIDKTALQQLQALPSKPFRNVASAVFDLQANATPPAATLLPATSYRCLAVGPYRIIYRVEQKVVHVLVVAKRGDSPARAKPSTSNCR